MMAAELEGCGVTLAALLAEFLPGDALPGVLVNGLATDSRDVRPGDLFLACQGLREHALVHAAQAVQGGAVAVLWEPGADASLQAMADNLPVPALPVVALGHKLGLIADRFYAHPTRDMQVVGVTGTDGKTSVTHFIAQALSSAGEPCGLLGTLGYGVYGKLQAPTHTTPDAVRLQGEFARLRDAGVRCTSGARKVPASLPRYSRISVVITWTITAVSKPMPRPSAACSPVPGWKTRSLTWAMLLVASWSDSWVHACG
jgi:UDP-N-acetylmuramoyl-L-alanyl-D-glutamate--2,6-diaminopimelate ligase